MNERPSSSRGGRCPPLAGASRFLGNGCLILAAALHAAGCSGTVRTVNENVADAMSFETTPSDATAIEAIADGSPDSAMADVGSEDGSSMVSCVPHAACTLPDGAKSICAADGSACGCLENVTGRCESGIRIGQYDLQPRDLLPASLHRALRRGAHRLLS